MDLDHALQQLAADPAAPLDLAEVALRLAQDEYPGLDVEGYLSELAVMAHEVRAYLSGDLETRVHGLCRYLFHEMGFHGNTQHYYDARNSYLNEVLDRRSGLPITLSIVVMAVGCRAGLDVVGVGLPGHFVVKAILGEQSLLFDPFHGGRRLTVEQCEQLVEQATGSPHPVGLESLADIPTGRIVARLLANLKGVYLRDEDYARLIRVTERLRQLAPHDPTQRRDLGTTFLQVGQPGKAITHLEAYLEAMPLGTDVDAVRELLSQARSQLTQWNEGMKTALLLIAHGSREREANADLHHAVAQLRDRGRYAVVEACFLELAPPDIDTGADRCVTLGAAHVILLPYFLSAGVHVRRDLTLACQRLAERHREVQFSLAEPLGRHPLLIDVLSERAREAEASRDDRSRL